MLPRNEKCRPMIEILKLPSHVAAFRAWGKVTGKDYDYIINPKVEQVYKQFNQINYFLLLDTPISHYSTEAWIKDVVLGFVYFTQWNKIAIVSDKQKVKDFTNFFGKLIPGKTIGFMRNDLEKAIHWVSQS